MWIPDLLVIMVIVIAASAVAFWVGSYFAMRVRPYEWDIVKLVIQFFS
jgi:hypothetical protein